VGVQALLWARTAVATGLAAVHPTAAPLVLVVSGLLEL
jgi:hypothetical protein